MNSQEKIKFALELFKEIDKMKIYKSPSDKTTFRFSTHYGYACYKRKVLSDLGLSKEDIDTYFREECEKNEKEQLEQYKGQTKREFIETMKELKSLYSQEELDDLYKEYKE
jgi:hypothetical protein